MVRTPNGRPRSERKSTWDAAANAPIAIKGKPTSGRWRAFDYDELVARDKCSLDLFWLRDESLEDSASLPEPHVLAGEIADDLRSALEQIDAILADLQLPARPSREGA